MNNNLKIAMQMKNFIYELDTILILFPKQETVLKNNLKSICFEILETIYYANLVEERTDIQKRIISKISMLDFYFEYSFKKKYISEKQLETIVYKLENITKMMYGWMKYEG